MSLAYVEMVEDETGGFVSTAHVRRGIDPILNAATAPGSHVHPVDREAWLRGQDAKTGQASMLNLAKNRGR